LVLTLAHVLAEDGIFLPEHVGLCLYHLYVFAAVYLVLINKYTD